MENDRELYEYFRVCAIQKLKIHLIAHYSNATSLWKGVPALRSHVQNVTNASELRQAVKLTAKTVDEDPVSCKRWISRKEIKSAEI